jgi:hypothetical protein
MAIGAKPANMKLRPDPPPDCKTLSTDKRTLKDDLPSKRIMTDLRFCSSVRR